MERTEAAAAGRRSISGTLTLRCQDCDNKLAPARTRPVAQEIRRTCSECGQVWRIRVRPRNTVLGGFHGVTSRPDYQAEYPTTQPEGEK